MSYNFEQLKKNILKYLIVMALLWVILVVIIIVPITIVSVDVKNDTEKSVDFIQNFSEEILNFKNISKVVKEPYVNNFKTILGTGSLVYFVFIIVMISKLNSKNEYKDIEHGSSGWCENGEQYKVLHKKKGIILAEKNYLPVDKRGNINVLVVGRIWFR